MKHRLRFAATSSILAMLISDTANAAQAAALQVPEPGTLLLAGLGISALIFSRRKK